MNSVGVEVSVWIFFFFSSRRRHTRWTGDWSSDVCSSDLARRVLAERIAVVCAARTGAGDDVLAGLPVLPVHPLGDSDARALLLANVPGPLDEIGRASCRERV